MIWGPKHLHRVAIYVEGIRCNHCESTIKLALRKIPGVKRVRIHKRKQVVIDFELPTIAARAQFVSTIQKAGYKIGNTPNQD